jgi:hypothetical protein
MTTIREPTPIREVTRVKVPDDVAQALRRVTAANPPEIPPEIEPPMFDIAGHTKTRQDEVDDMYGSIVEAARAQISGLESLVVMAEKARTEEMRLIDVAQGKLRPLVEALTASREAATKLGKAMVDRIKAVAAAGNGAANV